MYSRRFMKSTRLESFQRDRGIYVKRVRFTSKASIGNIGVFLDVNFVYTGFNSPNRSLSRLKFRRLKVPDGLRNIRIFRLKRFTGDCQSTFYGRKHRTEFVLTEICKYADSANFNLLVYSCRRGLRQIKRTSLLLVSHAGVFRGTRFWGGMKNELP